MDEKPKPVNRLVWRRCPRCKRRAATRVEYVGRRVRCPLCRRVFIVTERCRD